MPKDKPHTSSGDYERKPWRKKPYMLRLIKSDEIENRYYHDEAWVDKDGKARRADDPIEATQYKLCFEVIKGDKEGDWVWAFAPHWFALGKDGKPKGKRAVIATSIDPEFDLSAGIENDHSDIMHGVCMGLVEPDPKNPQYGKITSFYPVEEGEEIPGPMADAMKKAGGANVPEVNIEDLGKTPEVEEEEIPFAHPVSGRAWWL